MTLSEFYRDEAARCQRRAEKSRLPHQAQRWNALADEYLQVSLLMEGAAEKQKSDRSGTRHGDGRGMENNFLVR
jgi:hypothetical protein